MNKSNLVATALALTLLAGCSASTNLQALQPNTQLRIKTNSETAVPRTADFSTTSFGNYEFEAKAAGHEPMYGILPLKFNGGYLAVDILLFAPAAFFNLREVFPYYEFDPASGVLRYKKTEAESWSSYTPLPAESDRAKAYFAKTQ
jgi:hypothetical protein